LVEKKKGQVLVRDCGGVQVLLKEKKKTRRRRRRRSLAW